MIFSSHQFIEPMLIKKKLYKYNGKPILFVLESNLANGVYICWWWHPHDNMRFSNVFLYSETYYCLSQEVVTYFI